MDNEKNEMKLDDTQRVRVLSPGMMVAKRFFRNKLAITGLVIIVLMFLFSFVGGAVMPYSQSEVFHTTETMKKDYAGATKIEEYMMFSAEDAKLAKDIRSKMLIAIGKNESVFETRDKTVYGLGKLTDSAYMIYAVDPVKNPLAMKSKEHEEALAEGRSWFTYEDQLYIASGEGARAQLYQAQDIAVACKLSFTAYDDQTSFSYDFYKAVLTAVCLDEKTAEADGVTYSIEEEGGNATLVRTADGKDYAYVSDMNVNCFIDGVFLSPEFKEQAINAIVADEKEFTLADEKDGKDTTYMISNKNGQYTIKRYKETKVLDQYAAPSAKHLAGTDANGMDLMARLMYGGRISLLIGFVVVFIELLIGVIVGGIAGFFGGWVDNLLMRLVDIVYCIPAMPLYLILGSIMDYYKAGPTVRIYMLCIIMSVVGWVGIARIIRGQILSLREQEFMLAAEALGIRTSRRIFKHLVPNVIPQIVVYASMGIGDVILAESALSFLGLGIKYPAATWGSIINAVTNSYVMTNYLFVWIPAGLLILLTVLAFNFIGDGLRDAFDPKMKR